MTEIQRQSIEVKDALLRAVAAALDKKRCLGQYAVVYRNGEVVRIEPPRSQAEESAEP